ncbi:alpha-2,8-sialyltransferase 8B-like, partial [Branchiostoma lanceolatum]|uniref:alpha-2,8-sialyltransferase 8B-like n=1 Tax=Branchiostoma lanceolatum TaxID=7740 RepID=UPI00345505D6
NLLQFTILLFICPLFVRRNITKRYFDPKRHIIYSSDYNIFMQKCDHLTFTLRNSATSHPKPCDVVHTPVRHYPTCAVVGNSGILLRSSCGTEIDAHEFVIRSNLPPVHHYQRDVGSKTNLTIVNVVRLSQVSEALQSSNPLLRTAMLVRLGESPGMVFSYAYSFTSKARSKMQVIDAAIRKNNLSTITAFPHRSLLNSKSLYTELADKQWKFASTGLNTFALASTFCDRISMYGFYPMSTYQNQSVPYHYYDGRVHSKRHDFDAEYAIIQQMDKDGIIRHVVGKCSFEFSNVTN